MLALLGALVYAGLVTGTDPYAQANVSPRCPDDPSSRLAGSSPYVIAVEEPAVTGGEDASFTLTMHRGFGGCGSAGKHDTSEVTLRSLSRARLKPVGNAWGSDVSEDHGMRFETHCSGEYEHSSPLSLLPLVDHLHNFNPPLLPSYNRADSIRHDDWTTAHESAPGGVNDAKATGTIVGDDVPRAAIAGGRKTVQRLEADAGEEQRFAVLTAWNEHGDTQQALGMSGAELLAGVGRVTGLVWGEDYPSIARTPGLALMHNSPWDSYLRPLMPAHRYPSYDLRAWESVRLAASTANVSRPRILEWAYALAAGDEALQSPSFVVAGQQDVAGGETRIDFGDASSYSYPGPALATGLRGGALDAAKPVERRESGWRVWEPHPISYVGPTLADGEVVALWSRRTLPGMAGAALSDTEARFGYGLPTAVPISKQERETRLGYYGQAGYSSPDCVRIAVSVPRSEYRVAAAPEHTVAVHPAVRS